MIKLFAITVIIVPLVTWLAGIGTSIAMAMKEEDNDDGTAS